MAVVVKHAGYAALAPAYRSTPAVFAAVYDRNCGVSS
jgi:hypothetical protein